MRYTVIASAASLTIAVLCLASSGGSNSTTATQTAATQEVDPKVLAFLKPAEIADGDSELQKKLKERHNAAVRLLEERVNEYKRGVRDASFVFDAARLTADAKLDLASTAEARSATLQQVLDVAKIVEGHLQQQLDKGFGSKADLERARYDRLNVEVEILKAKQQ
jgi:hypothetical protein